MPFFHRQGDEIRAKSAALPPSRSAPGFNYHLLEQQLPRAGELKGKSTRACCFSCSGARCSSPPLSAPRGCSAPGQVKAARGRGEKPGWQQGGGGKKNKNKKKPPATQPLHRGYPGDRANNWRGEQCILIKPLQETRGGNRVNCTEREQEIKNARRSEDGGSHPPSLSKNKATWGGGIAGRTPGTVGMYTQSCEMPQKELRGSGGGPQGWRAVGTPGNPGKGVGSQDMGQVPGGPPGLGHCLQQKGMGDVSHHSPIPIPSPSQDPCCFVPSTPSRGSAFSFSCPAHFRFQPLPGEGEKHPRAWLPREDAGVRQEPQTSTPMAPNILPGQGAAAPAPKPSVCTALCPPSSPPLMSPSTRGAISPAARLLAAISPLPSSAEISQAVVFCL